MLLRKVLKGKDCKEDSAKRVMQGEWYIKVLQAGGCRGGACMMSTPTRILKEGCCWEGAARRALKSWCCKDGAGAAGWLL